MHRISHIQRMGLSMRVAVIVNGNCRQCRSLDLVEAYPVTVYDREIRPGGHSHTVSIDYDGTQLSVDIGFIVYNESNYPDPDRTVRAFGSGDRGELHELCGHRRRRPL